MIEDDLVWSLSSNLLSPSKVINVAGKATNGQAVI